MDGYSVTEAASVLGVPTERVWELLARGVLSGAPDGETGMRVFLQPRPAPVPPAPAIPESPPRTEPDRELSPFRELLTEFRNLTERYGQALLALGEARGEVAALRSRVDLLEARMDLRLPSGFGAAAPAWSADSLRAAPASAPPPPQTAEDAASRGSAPLASDTGASLREAAPAEGDEGEDSERRARRRRTSRRATESFAEALARADDPSVPELPAAAAAAAALAALREAAPAEGGDAGMPRELPAADAVPVADEPAPVAGGPAVVAPEEAAMVGDDLETPEPRAAPIDDQASDVEASEPPQGEPAVAAIEAVPAPAAGTGSGRSAAPISEPAPSEGVTATEADGPESTTQAEPEPQPQPQPMPEPATSVDEPATTPEPEATPAPPSEPAWDQERYSTVIEEPDWYAADDQEAAPPAAPPPAAPEPAATAPPRADEPGVPPAGEETVLWFGREPDAVTPEPMAADPDASEAADDRSSLLPGSRELDEALAALDALAGPATRPIEIVDVGPVAAESPADEMAEPAPAAVGVPGDDAEWPPSNSDARPERAPRADPATEVRPATPGTAPGTLLRDVRRPSPLPPSPASRAYRRLRRIFPG